MQDLSKNIENRQRDGELDLLELLDVILKGRVTIALVTAFFSVTMLIYSLSIPNIYKSEAKLAPVEVSSNISNLMKNYGTLASFAGVNLPNEDADSNSVQALEKLKSLSFFENNFLPNIFLPNLMAFDSWNPSSNSIQYKNNLYDSENHIWVRKVSFPKNIIPSAQESFITFKENHFSIIEDANSGLLTLSVKHQSPYIAKNWAELIVKEINLFYRLKDKLEAQKAVNYLNEQIKETNFAEIKEVLAELLQQETQKLTLIEVNESYVFDFIDPPAVMELKSEPARALICILGALLGFILGVAITLIRHFNAKY